MEFLITLNSGSGFVSERKAFVTDNNDFRTASMMAASELFGNTEADNVSAYRVIDGMPSRKPFFYAEKG